MKRTISLLLAIVALAACVSAHADGEEWFPEPTKWGQTFSYSGLQGMEDALRQAGRFVIGLSAVQMDYTDDFALVIIENDSASQMTILRRMGDNTWQIEACNDTIPFHQFNDNEARWWRTNNISVEGGANPLNEEKSDAGYYRLELKQSFDYGFVNKMVHLGIRQGADGWYISGFNLILFTSEDGTELEKAPYYFLWENKNISENKNNPDDWSFRYYEFVDHGIGLERTRDPLYAVSLPQDEIMAHTRLDAFDYPAFLSWLNGLLPVDLPDSFTVPGTMTDPSADNVFYYNPQGGRYYHADPNCASVSEIYRPLTPIPYALLDTNDYRHLLSCPFCIVDDPGQG